jgi:hypothetical protein
VAGITERGGGGEACRGRMSEGVCICKQMERGAEGATGSTRGDLRRRAASGRGRLCEGEIDKTPSRKRGTQWTCMRMNWPSSFGISGHGAWFGSEQA